MSQISKKIQVVSFDGSIGSGKTTMMERVRKHYENNPNVIFACEPVDKWSNIKDLTGTTILNLFYKDQEQYAFSFQMMAYISRLSGLREIARANPDKKITIITERSLYTDKYVFAKMLYDQGKIKEVEYQIYLMWFDEFAKDFEVDNVIYIKTDPEKCYERIHTRAREGEELIPLAYLEECHKYHEEFLHPNSGLFQKQLVLDGNQDIFKNNNVVSEWIDQIDAFIMTPPATLI